MCMEENAAEACMEVSEQTENSEGVTENDGQVASDGLADNAGENQWESPAEGSRQGQPESDGNKYGQEQLVSSEDGEVQVAIKFLTPVLSAEEGAAALENREKRWI